MLRKENLVNIFWNIGKRVFDDRFSYNNAVEKWSLFYQYYYGKTEMFNRKMINKMKRFYLIFPIYTTTLISLEWIFYERLIKIEDKKELMFYYNLVFFCKLSYEEMCNLIDSNAYFRV